MSALHMTVPMEVGICCADLDALAAFYTGVMGLTLVNRVTVPADKARATGLTAHGYDVARLQTSYGAMLADEIQRRYFDWLDQPVKRVTGGEASPSISKVLERAAFADTDEVVAGLADVLADLGEQP